jgi:pilus assembly protein Flp/PilA
MSKFISNVKAFMQDEEGLSVVEYVIGAGLLAVGLTQIFSGLSTDMAAELDAVFDGTNSSPQ